MMMRIGINGLGRIGRLAIRALQIQPTMELVHVNDIAGDAATHAHLLAFDSVHGRWDVDVSGLDDRLVIDGRDIKVTSEKTLDAADFSDCDLVLECTGKFKTVDALKSYRDQGVQQTVVSAPIKVPEVLNVVMGVNDRLFSPDHHPIVTAASCTTNCIAPAIQVIHQTFGIRHGSITTVHDITNTQTILDAPHKDLRRARACGMSLIPTTTGSATAIAEIFPELRGRLNGHAIRVPLANASVTDCVFELQRAVTVDEVNQALKHAAEGELSGILGYEERPLVSVDYKTDPRSSIVDALSTMVVNDTQLKLYLWYDNEWGYANRLVELAAYTGAVRGL
ncbi:MAG: ArsJ-associated glyceraldehyde-3-phosphate dehydrogenase [Litorivicinaceae bacterium]